jgi:hypothetical protein
MDEENWKEPLFFRLRKAAARIHEEHVKRYKETAESLSHKYPDLSRALKDLIQKGVRIETTKDGGIIIDSPADVYEEGYTIKFKCRERTCTVRGILETAGDRGSMELFREKMRDY